MSTLIMLIGLASSGKSTIAKRIASEIGAVVHSSDELRLELFGSYDVQDRNEELFKELHCRVLADISIGNNVVYDATNISYKNRKSFLRIIPQGVYRKAVVVATTYHDCLMRDMVREKSVGRDVLHRMYNNFQFPLISEGFDEIVIEFNSEHNNIEYMVNLTKMAETFDQDNKNHRLKLGAHMTLASVLYLYACNNKEYYYSDDILMALMFHDIGKMFCQTYNEKSTNAHYYGHECISAYEAMFICNFNQEVYDPIYVIQLINYHMTPYSIESEKSQKKLLDKIGENMYNDIIAINRFDREAH